MRCADFLEKYSDYRDGLMAHVEAARMTDHIGDCASCARYDRVVVQGVDHFRAIPEAAPSTDFIPRLQHRIYDLENQLTINRQRSGASAGLAVALALAIVLAAWMPVVSPRQPAVVRLDPVAVSQPVKTERGPSLFLTAPLPPSDLSGRQLVLVSSELLHGYPVSVARNGSTTPSLSFVRR